jgi:hypothetical protein
MQPLFAFSIATLDNRYLSVYWLQWKSVFEFILAYALQNVYCVINKEKLESKYRNVAFITIGFNHEIGVAFEG